MTKMLSGAIDGKFPGSVGELGETMHTFRIPGPNASPEELARFIPGPNASPEELARFEFWNEFMMFIDDIDGAVYLARGDSRKCAVWRAIRAECVRTFERMTARCST